MATWIALAVLALLVLWAILTFNRLVRLRQRVDNGWSQIDVQLRRRYDLIPNLVETVKGYAAHERELFERVTLARAQAIDATGVAGQAEAENAVTSGLRQLLGVVEAYPELKANENFRRPEAENAVTSGLRQLLGVVEAYPELKANENFLALQEELTGTESKIAYARQFYNDQVMRLNTAIQSFPSLVLAKPLGFTEREFFEIDDPAARGPVSTGLGER